MKNILQFCIGKHFGIPDWIVECSSPFNKDEIFVWKMDEIVSTPYPGKRFTRDEVESLRDYLNKVLEEYELFMKRMEEINV